MPPFWVEPHKCYLRWKYIQLYYDTASQMRLRACDHYALTTLIGGKGGAGPSLLHTYLHLRDQRSKWIQEGCKVHMDTYMASNRSCFMVTWTIFENHLLEVGLTQNRETMALRVLNSIDDLFNFIMCEDPHEQKFIEITFGWGPGHSWLHSTLEDPWPHYMI